MTPALRRATALALRCRAIPGASQLASRRAIASGAEVPPDGLPKIVSAIPGPKTKESMAELGMVMNCSSVPFFVDLEQSYGNYVVDGDGNRLLDMFGQIAALPVGYNHPDLLAMAKSQSSAVNLANRTAMSRHPPVGYGKEVMETLMAVAPNGMTDVMPMMCGSCAVENALKCVFMWFKAKERGDVAFTMEEESSCMLNSPPGSTDASILSFQGGFHGRTLGALSVTRSKALHKVDIPAFDWPVAPFPRLKYPLDRFAAENRAEEQRCVAAVEVLVAEWRDKGRPVAGVIVEPIQAEGGDNHASAEFFTAIRKVTAEAGAAFIVDEVQTGVASTGYMWAHEKWNLENPPDVMTFAKKMQIGGYFMKRELRPQIGGRVLNTWYGDAARMGITKEILRVIKRDNLVAKAAETGALLLDGLKELEAKFPSLISNVRGQGTFCAIDCCDAQTQEKLIAELHKVGVHSGACGDTGIRFRPSLVFTPLHVAIAMELLHKAVSNI